MEGSDKVYKLSLKDGTVINLKSIDTDNDTNMIVSLDTDLSHDEAIEKFSISNLSCVQILCDDVVINTYVNFKEVAESSVKNGTIIVNIEKCNTKELVINLRKENDTCNNALSACNDAITELYNAFIMSTI